jgi:hypothetical protein
MYRRSVQFGWKRAVAGNDQSTVFNACIDVVGINPGQRYQDKNRPIGLQNVGRGFPGGETRSRVNETKKFVMHALGTGQHFAGL